MKKILIAISLFLVAKTLMYSSELVVHVKVAARSLSGENKEYKTVRLPSGRIVYLSNKIEFEWTQFERVELLEGKNQDEDDILVVQLNESDTQKLAAFDMPKMHDMVLLLNNKIIFSGGMLSPIKDGYIQISSKEMSGETVSKLKSMVKQ